ncbi:hypothetical protein EDD86DRAFT_275723 [Gorgonomyces haynaldii]|nr:hypothetical protein EDD86DRAFT_275723 [Gorgonomyces haynaldii]
MQRIFKRALSGEVYMPSVSMLIHLNHLNPETVAQIPRSGPKNRLLKGDVLAYLKDGLVDADLVMNEQFYVKSIRLSPFNQKLETSKIELGSVLAAAALSSLEQHQIFKHKSIHWTRVAPAGASACIVDPSKTQSKQLEKQFRDEQAQIAPGAFRIVDLTQFKEIPLHLQNGESAILSFVPEEDLETDFDDLLGETRPIQSRSYPIEDQTPDQIALELIVDGRKVTQKQAFNFLQTFEDRLQELLL